MSHWQVYPVVADETAESVRRDEAKPQARPAESAKANSLVYDHELNFALLSESAFWASVC